MRSGLGRSSVITVLIPEKYQLKNNNTGIYLQAILFDA